MFWNLNRQVWQDAASHVWSCSEGPGAQDGKVDIDMKTTFEPIEAGSGSLVMLFSLL